MFCENYENLIFNLEKRGFTPHTASSRDEARAIALALVGDASVGVGGSVSVRELGLFDEFTKNGNMLNTHDGAPKGSADIERRLARQADFYLCSTNAMTYDGKLVNIDGVGNRVAAMIFGPKNVIMIVGKNKLASNIEAAIERIHTVACPQNAARLNRVTPCRTNGVCSDCDAPDRMCNVTSIIERKTGGISTFHIILVDDDLGY